MFVQRLKDLSNTWVWIAMRKTDLYLIASQYRKISFCQLQDAYYFIRHTIHSKTHKLQNCNYCLYNFECKSKENAKNFTRFVDEKIQKHKKGLIEELYTKHTKNKQNKISYFNLISVLTN